MRFSKTIINIQVGVEPNPPDSKLMSKKQLAERISAAETRVTGAKVQLSGDPGTPRQVQQGIQKGMELGAGMGCQGQILVPQDGSGVARFGVRLRTKPE